MTNCNDIDKVDEGDSAYATITATENIQFIDTTFDEVDEGDSAYATITTTENIQFIDTTTEWSNWCDDLAEAMFTK
ncbi:retrotransposon protein [Cucumis melo var. makuwa]|uniref:Retrotransposon protein n=1 Tax=Cucumis melo var. makuwa TaxID=1194695 RepID=A0A5A7VC46_CUCMM|nr:retrotransposon protein [Cucumis melo var. makuwa]TYJ96522.1 retrotransposon protein [Cucumis melo var. makuwa]